MSGSTFTFNGWRWPTEDVIVCPIGDCEVELEGNPTAGDVVALQCEHLLTVHPASTLPARVDGSLPDVTQVDGECRSCGWPWTSGDTDAIDRDVMYGYAPCSSSACPSRRRSIY